MQEEIITDKAGPAAQPEARLNRLQPAEIEVIHLFIQFAATLGQPRSVAEIYGLLFVSHLPLTLQDLKERLGISLGSTSQGLQFLRELGAVRVVEIPNSRRTHFAAVAELRNLAGSFLRQQISTHLNDSETRLERIDKRAKSLTGEARTHALGRLSLLRSWPAASNRW